MDASVKNAKAVIWVESATHEASRRLISQVRRTAFKDANGRVLLRVRTRTVVRF